jgi:hypothetical protein
VHCLFDKIIILNILRLHQQNGNILVPRKGCHGFFSLGHHSNESLLEDVSMLKANANSHCLSFEVKRFVRKSSRTISTILATISITAYERLLALHSVKVEKNPERVSR